MQCPRCGSFMQEEYYGLTLDLCRTCGGIWFDADELQEALQQPSSARMVVIPSPTPPVLRDHSLQCPRCGSAPLTTRRIHGGQVHGCEQCHGVYVGSRTFLKILDRKSYGLGAGALDVLFVGPDIAEIGIKGFLEVLEVLAEVFVSW